ncbi:MAG: hypothetical protein C5B51_08140 [Terriglobia bacterium]|nr:MAG: hypothetical protein C5B51_08140 [Terriglobia bacterium]
MANADWPELPLAVWKDTYATLHMWTQIVGKTRMTLSPPVNHWWHVPLYVSTRGLTTSPIPYGSRTFEVEFDFVSHNVSLRASDGQLKFIPLYPRSVADFYREYMHVLASMSIEVKFWKSPVEVADPIAFDQDEQHASYDAEYASRFWRILVNVDSILKEFRARFTGKVSPVHFFWGSFDLAVTRFSSRRAPERAGADLMTREAYSHECASAGFWPGAGIDAPAFYSYSAPEPEGYSTQAVQPEAAFYHPELHEFVLKYDDVRRSASPRAALLEFFQSTYDAAATLAHWDRAALETAGGRHAGKV